MKEKRPSDNGFFMPAEWHPHDATWLTWPKDPVTWPDRVPLVEEIFLRMIQELASRERVELLVDDRETENGIRGRLKRAGSDGLDLRFHRVRTADSWIRDYGPNFLIKRGPDGVELAYNHWVFNAWGNKYAELKKDAAIPEILAPVLGLPRFTPGIVLEGGSIDVNGEGICLTTEQCLLNANRNPGLSRIEIEQHLKDHLGVRNVIWLGEGIVGDDTDGHIDDIARFVRPDTIVCATEEDSTDPNYALLRDNHERLQKARTQEGKPFEVITLPMPGPVESSDGRLPASYANFYIANRLVLVPIFGHRNDTAALETLGRLFPGREIVGINCEPLVWGLGTIHCVTQQQPARV